MMVLEKVKMLLDRTHRLINLDYIVQQIRYFPSSQKKISISYENNRLIAHVSCVGPLNVVVDRCLSRSSETRPKSFDLTYFAKYICTYYVHTSVKTPLKREVKRIFGL